MSMYLCPAHISEQGAEEMSGKDSLGCDAHLPIVTVLGDQGGERLWER